MTSTGPSAALIDRSDGSDGSSVEHVVPCRSPRLVSAIMCAAVAFVYGSGTILFSALAVVARDLDASQTQLQWITGCYPLVIAALLLPGGAFVDRIGRKVGVVLGLVITSVFFLAATQTVDAGMVILFMGLAGLGGAMSFPATLATIAAVVPKERRGPAVAMWSVSLFVGGLIGTCLGGVLSEYVDWEWLLVPAAGTGLLIALLSLVVVPESRDPEAALGDVRGAALSVLAVGLFVFGMTEAPTRGWTDPLAMTAVLGVVFGVLFVVSQLRASHPLLDVRVFADGRFAAGSLFNLLSWLTAYGCFFTAVLYRAYALDLSPLMTGLSFAPAGLCIPFGFLGPRLTRRYGARATMTTGLLVLAAGSLVIAVAATTQTYWPVVVGETILFSGLAIAGGTATEAIIDSLPPAKHGVASAVNDITRQLGIALGVAVLGSLFNYAYRADVAANDGVDPATLEATRDSAAQGLSIASGLPSPFRESQTEAVQQAVALGYTAATAALTVIMLVGAFLLWRRCPPGGGRATTRPGEPAVTAVALAAPDPAETSPAACMAELVEVTARFQQLVGQAQRRQEAVEERIRVLEAQEWDLIRRCGDLREQHAAYLTERAQAAQADCEDWPPRDRRGDEPSVSVTAS